MSRFWFARQYPIERARTGILPVHRNGWLALAAFMAADLAALAGAALLTLSGNWPAALALFLGVTLIAGGALLATIAAKTDFQRCAADYRSAPSALGTPLVR